jgi:hypothetical protein
VRRARREFIEERLDVGSAAMLEIGAMDSPTFPERDSRYLDWFSREELQKALAGNPNRAPDRIVEPDYVVKQKRFAAAVPARFDAVIANHVLEHVADPILWLEQVGELSPAGNLFLTVPDRRYTFDYLRPVSTAADFLRAYAEDLERPSRWQMLEAIFYHRPVRANDVWGGDFSEKLEHRRFQLDTALATSAKADREYVDVHCHVFTSSSFADLIEDLAVGGFIGWRVAAVQDVAQGANEFYVHLVPR